MKKTQTLEAETILSDRTATIGEEQVLKLMKNLRTEVEQMDRSMDSYGLNFPDTLLTRHNTTKEILLRLERIFVEVTE